MQKRRQKVYDYIQKVKASSPCVDCNTRFPYWVMQFDHKVGELKVFNISRAKSLMVTLPRIKAEIEKCDVVCAICHSHRTYCREKGVPHYLIRAGRAGIAESSPNPV